MGKILFKQNEIIVLLGAGASVDAGVPDSAAMVRQIEELVSSDNGTWRQFRALYHYVRSAIYYAEGIDGTFGDGVLFNIERLVSALDELRKKERHPLYPFVGAWNPKLLEVAGQGFENVHRFRTEIVKILRNNWVELERSETAAYYGGLLRFQREYEYPLRVFSLNYDLCVERICGASCVQRGFEDRQWDWRLFDETSDDSFPILLYKLHGSIDWKMADGRVTFIDAPGTIDEEDLALIFGTVYKLQYVDPFLFLAYELRRWTIAEVRIIVTVGYGFGDEHINGILSQALRQDEERKLLAVLGPGAAEEMRRKSISEVLRVSEGQISVETVGAKKFLSQTLSIDYLAGLFPDEVDLIEEITDAG